MAMENEIVSVTEQVARRHGADVAQEVAQIMVVRHLDGRLHNKNLKSWAMQRAYRNKKDESIRDSRMQSMGDNQDYAFTPSNQESSALLREILATKQGKRIFKHLTGEQPIKNRQYLHQLRRELKGML